MKRDTDGIRTPAPASQLCQNDPPTDSSDLSNLIGQLRVQDQPLFSPTAEVGAAGGMPEKFGQLS